MTIFLMFGRKFILHLKRNSSDTRNRLWSFVGFWLNLKIKNFQSYLGKMILLYNISNVSLNAFTCAALSDNCPLFPNEGPDQRTVLTLRDVRWRCTLLSTSGYYNKLNTLPFLVLLPSSVLKTSWWSPWQHRSAYCVISFDFLVKAEAMCWTVPVRISSHTQQEKSERRPIIWVPVSKFERSNFASFLSEGNNSVSKVFAWM